MSTEPIFWISRKEVASIYNTIEEALCHFIIKESIGGQRMEAAAKHLKETGGALYKKAEDKFENMRDTLYAAGPEYRMLIVFSDSPTEVIVEQPLFKDSKPGLIVNLPNTLIYGTESDATKDYLIMRDLFSWLFSMISSLEGIGLKRVVEFFAQITIVYDGPEAYKDETIEMAKKMNIYVQSNKENIILDENKIGDLIEFLIYG